MIEADERAAVTTEARSWIGTPYHDNAMIKGVGVDCAMIIKAVYEAVGVISDIAVEPYSPQWYLHRSEEKYLAYVSAHAREITEAEALPGDMVLYKFGRCFSHGAFVIEPGWPDIIHAYRQAGIVTLARGDLGHLVGRERRFFSPRKWGAV